MNVWQVYCQAGQCSTTQSEALKESGLEKEKSKEILKTDIYIYIYMEVTQSNQS